MILLHYFAIEAKLDTPKTLFSQIFTIEKKYIHNKFYLSKYKLT
jgi:hypothetical protein